MLAINRCIILALSVLSGCASVTSGGTQELSVATFDQASQPVEAECDLRNDKGQWATVTPGRVTVKQSYQDLEVNCRAATHEPGALNIRSTTKGAVFGNLVVGGLIGASIDVSSGAAYEYRNPVSILMGPLIQGPAAPAASRGQVDLKLLAHAGRLTYVTTDLFTQVQRTATVEPSQSGARLGQPGLGDLSDFEPPSGWAQGPVIEGMNWKLAYEAKDGLPRSAVSLHASVVGRERVRTAVGDFWAFVVEYRGTANRSNGTIFNGHPTLLRVWLDVGSLRPVKFESDIRGSFGSQGGRPSKERAELVNVLPLAAL